MGSIEILVFNCGSSSLNYKVFSQAPSGEVTVLARGKAHRVGVTGSEPSFIEHHAGERKEKQVLPLENHQQAASLVLARLEEWKIPYRAIGHRFVHGGEYFSKSALLSPMNMTRLESCLPLAPIHNPNSFSVIEACSMERPELPQYASFDTAFHASLPEWAYTYALPPELIRKFGFRKYGFHGLSYKYILGEIGVALNTPPDNLKIVACHLGTGGSSITAIKEGKSLDTSMGYTPLQGLMMSTRCGDLDPLLPLFLIKEKGMSPNELIRIFNNRSGLLGVSGYSADIRDITVRMGEDERSRLAFDMYVYKLRQYIGAYAALLEGMDVLAFTDDVGVLSPEVREAACRDMEWCGLQIDLETNRSAPHDRPALLSRPESRVRILCLPTDEEKVIAQEGFSLFKEAGFALL